VVVVVEEGLLSGLLRRRRRRQDNSGRGPCEGARAGPLAHVGREDQLAVSSRQPARIACLWGALRCTDETDSSPLLKDQACLKI